jgi:hypothetical protein
MNMEKPQLFLKNPNRKPAHPEKPIKTADSTNDTDKEAVVLDRAFTRRVSKDKPLDLL